MQPKTLLVLLAVVLCLGAFIVFYEKDLPSTDEREELAGKVLGLEADAVDALVLGNGAVRLERVTREEPSADIEDDVVDALTLDAALEGGGWRLTEPLAARADAVAVDDLVERLIGLGKERELDEVERADLGLDAPRSVVTLETARGPVTLRVGDELPLGDSVAVEIERGGTATLAEATRIPDDLLDLLAQGADDWRDPRLVPAARSAIERIVLTPSDSQADGAGSPGPEQLVLSRRGSGETFWLEEPFEDRAASEAVGPLLTGLADLAAVSFLDDGDDGLAEPAITAEITLAGDGEPLRIEVAGLETASVETASSETAGVETASSETAGVETASSETAGVETASFETAGVETASFEDLAVDTTRTVRVVSADGDQRATAEVGFLVDALSRSLDAWRSRDLTSMQVFEIDAASFEGPALERLAGVERLEIERVDGAWQRLVDGEGVELDYSVASAALYPLADAVAEDLADASTVRLAAPQLRVELRAGETSEEVTVHGGPSVAGEDASGAPALVGSRPVVLFLSAESVAAIYDALPPLAELPEADEVADPPTIDPTTPDQSTTEMSEDDA
ncbi:MAG: DUF4340 domain-containing protein [Acidobacteriota bacterium]